MDYSLSEKQFQEGKMFDSNGKFKHNTGYKFKLFPFTTHKSSPVEDLEPLIGTFLRQIEEKNPIGITVSELVENLSSQTTIEVGQEQIFYETVKQLYFDNDEHIRPLNLQMLSHYPCKEVSEEKVAEYLVDVLGDKSKLKLHIQYAQSKASASYNVFERLVLSNLKRETIVADSGLSYYRVIDSLREIFEKDFEYILVNQTRVRDYLVSLLEFYFFSYTAQTCMQLDCFLYGERNQNIPLYFCLEWEKTSQSRQCFTDGWKKLQHSIERMFAHVVVLEILNHTEANSMQIDYIELQKMVSENPECEMDIALKIDNLTRMYRNAITDCAEMNDLEKEDHAQGAVASSIKYLFDSVRIQFENTGRATPYESYSGKFESFCTKFLKNRGRSGLMLSLSEETLIFLTKISIKDDEQMRLKDVFEEFENRGVFLDDISKEQVAAYYEKLNLIEKKSDSGDAKYVKRIL
ncbi:MAG TPA: DNA phosphorothioation-dependent restriction protein DptG [Acinetobacter nosocomialis]|nr:DNA phosphorothioation-dependent restriction protein DptG [Acinetobacter nosocomialis]